MDFLNSLYYPDEVIALVQYKFGGCESVIPKCDRDEMSSTMKKCYEYLNKTSRSFAAVIMALDDDLRNPVCIFYLVLRALDTIEDDMTIPNETKIPLLKSFYTKLQNQDWCYIGSKEKDAIVLEDFPTISKEFRKLEPSYQKIISDICMKMGDGMCKFLETKVDTVKEWDSYCHYVAGLVGIGLSKLFAASGLEDPCLGTNTYLANSMGLFLQKTNIIRDYLEDVKQGREFWPKEVWHKYSGTLKELSKDDNVEVAVQCLNELISNALGHVPDVVEYLSKIKNQSVFNFCAIPQVMAIGTLERCYDNHAVFKSVVKIRKGEAVRMMIKATHMDSFKSIMSFFTREIQMRVPAGDPSAQLTRKLCTQTLELCQSNSQYTNRNFYSPFYVTLLLLMYVVIWKLFATV